MRPLKIIFLSFFIFFQNIKTEFITPIVTDATITVAPIVEQIGYKLLQNYSDELYPIIKKEITPKIESIVKKIQTSGEHKIESYFLKRKLFRPDNVQKLIDKEKKFNLKTKNNNSVTVNTYLEPSIYEKNYISKRYPRIKASIENLTGYNNLNLPNNYGSINENKLPKIAFMFSGGGYRSMIASLGFMSGASKVKKTVSGIEYTLIDTATHLASLSGSTWFLGIMLSLANSFNTKPQTLEEYFELLKKYLSSTVNCNFWNIKTFNVEQIEQHLWEKFFHNEGSLQVSDLWGALLADRLFKNLNCNGQEITFELVRNILDKSNHFPFPIFTANICNVWPYDWLEVNPFVSGFSDPNYNMGGFIPTSSFESKFVSGKSYSLYPEESIGSFWGIFGSAYSASLIDILDDLEISSKSEWFKEFVKWTKEKTKLYKDRFLRSNINNFMYYMYQFPLANLDKITVADAGMSMINLPFPPFFNLKRDIDIYIVCDASGDATKNNYPELQRVKAYADQYGFKFPTLKNKSISKHTENGQTYKCTIFEENDLTIPTVIYIPNYISVPTLKFNYSEEEFNELCDTMENMVIWFQKSIINAIKRKIDKKEKFYPFEAIRYEKSKMEKLSNFINKIGCFGLEEIDGGNTPLIIN